MTRTPGLTWKDLAPLLQQSAGSLPQVIFCPTCQRPSKVFEDTKSHVVWHYCPFCLRGQDGLDLLAAALNVDRKTAVYSLPAHLQIRTPEGITTFVDPFHKTREAANSFWEGIAPRTTSTRGVVGSCTVPEAEWYLVPDAERNSRGRPRNTQFHGEWGPLNVVAFQALPGQIDGFGFTDLEQEMVRPLPGRQTIGLAGLDALERANVFDGWAFVIDGLQPWVRIQTAHLMTDGHPLPLLGWTPRNHRPRWPLDDRRIVFPVHRIDMKTIAHASQCRGRIVSQVRWIGSPRDVLRALIPAARPWESVCRRLRKRPRREKMALLSAIREHGGSPEIEDILQIALPQDERHVRVGERTYIETEDGWFLQRRDGLQRITDFILRIETIVHENRRTTYRCRAIRRQAEGSFECPKYDMQRDAFTTLRMACVEAGLGNPTMIKTNDALLAIAIAFHPPRVLRIVDNTVEESWLEP